MSDQRPLVSIGLPVYNGAQFLEQTVTALLEQTHADFELLIFDNASTDETEDVGRACAARDERVRYHRNSENVGLAGNWNLLFRAARGEYFKWASADDLCKPEYLARCVAVLASDSSVVLAYPRTEFIDENEALLDIEDPGFDLQSDDPALRLRYVLYAQHWVNSILGLIRARALAKTKLMRGYAGADYVLLGELSLQGKFVEVPEVLFRRRLHPESSSQVAGDPEKLLKLITGRTGQISLPAWSRVLDHFQTIVRSRLSPGEKLALTGSLLHAMYWQQRRLRKELAVAVKTYAGMARH